MEKKATITFRLSEAEKAALEAIAAKKDISVSQFIREAIRKSIQEEEK